MARRFYSSVAQRTTLADQVNATTGTFIVNGVAGWPANTPYTLLVDADTINEEIVEVTARGGSTLTVTRGVDGSTGKAHDAGADVRHGVSGRDFSEKNQVYYQASTPTNAGTGDVWVDSDETA
jgi:hypothetical protein